MKELKGRKISLEELSAYPWISLTSEALTRKFLNNYFADHGLQFLPDMELATTRSRRKPWRFCAPGQLHPPAVRAVSGI